MLFLLIVVGLAAATIWGLVTYLPVAADPTPGPTTAATAAPTATPAPTRTPTPSAEPGTSAEPGSTDEPIDTAAPETAAPGQTDGPLPTREPRQTTTPEPAATPRPPRTGAIDEAIPVLRDNRRIGTVTLTSFAAADVPGVDVPAGGRVMVAELTYDSPVTGMPYDAANWQIVEADGTRHPSLGTRAPDPVLGKGRVAPGGSVTGNVAFIRERGMLIESIVLTDGNGNDLVVIERPPVP